MSNCYFPCKLAFSDLRFAIVFPRAWITFKEVPLNFPSSMVIDSFRTERLDPHQFSSLRVCLTRRNSSSVCQLQVTSQVSSSKKHNLTLNDNEPKSIKAPKSMREQPDIRSKLPHHHRGSQDIPHLAKMHLNPSDPVARVFRLA